MSNSNAPRKPRDNRKSWWMSYRELTIPSHTSKQSSCSSQPYPMPQALAVLPYWLCDTNLRHHLHKPIHCHMACTSRIAIPQNGLLCPTDRRFPAQDCTTTQPSTLLFLTHPRNVTPRICFFTDRLPGARLFDDVTLVALGVKHQVGKAVGVVVGADVPLTSRRLRPDVDTVAVLGGQSGDRLGRGQHQGISHTGRTDLPGTTAVHLDHTKKPWMRIPHYRPTLW